MVLHVQQEVLEFLLCLFLMMSSLFDLDLHYSLSHDISEGNGR